jgi:hypothetical protein
MTSIVYSQSGSKNFTAIPSAMVMTPSARNSHCHPDRPCSPETVSNAKARMPLKMPERFPRMSGICVSCVNSPWRNFLYGSQKYSKRTDISSGRYQYVSCRMTPGNMPASNYNTVRILKFRDSDLASTYQAQEEARSKNPFFIGDREM